MNTEKSIGLPGLQAPQGPQGVRGIRGPRGIRRNENSPQNFFRKWYTSIAEMEADFNNPDIAKDDLVAISTFDECKVYCKGAKAWIYVLDLKEEYGEQEGDDEQEEKDEKEEEGEPGIQGILPDDFKEIDKEVKNEHR